MQSSLTHNAFEFGLTYTCTVLISAHSLPAQLGRLGMSIALTNSVGRLASLFLRRLHFCGVSSWCSGEHAPSKSIGPSSTGRSSVTPSSFSPSSPRPRSASSTTYLSNLSNIFSWSRSKTYTVGKLHLLEFGPPTAARAFFHVHELLLSTTVANGQALRLIRLL